MSEDYSPDADEQLDALEAGPDPVLYNAVLDACALIFDLPGQAKRHSTTIVTPKGAVRVLPVPGYATRVYWTADPPRVEAVFPPT